MIKASELRIGNLFTDKLRRIHSVKGIHEDCIVIEYLRGVTDADNGWPTKSISFEDAQAIPLTIEWLRKFGFEGPIILRKKYIELEYGNFSKCWQYRNGEVLYDILHVHQLQNLYFAMTGEELMIKQAENAL